MWCLIGSIPDLCPLSYFSKCLTIARNLNIYKEAHGRDICFAKSEQCYHLNSKGAVAVAARLVDALATSQEETDASIILHCMHICETAPNTTHI